MSNPTTTVPTPVRKDRRGGIKSVVGDFVPAERLAVATNLQWVADNCDFPKAAPGLCYAVTPVEGNKEFGGLAVGDGPVFALYAGVQCYLGNDTDYEDRARAQLESGEGRGVEEVLWEYGMTAGGTGPAQTSWVAAIGQADEAADTLYVGRPIIMMSRFAAVQARAAKALFGDEEGNLWTANGTPVIASAAAPDDTLIVFGWITVYASPLIATTAPNPILNQEMALAERAYGIAVDCSFALHYAVTVAVSDPGEDPEPEPLVLQIGTQPSSPIPDGTDVTVTVQASEPVEEVNLWYRINGGGWTDNGEMTEIDSQEFVENLDGTLANPGDVFDLYAKSGTTTSPTITIEVT
jgi:hypothetical protein